MSTLSLRQQFDRDGYLVVKNFLLKEEVEELKSSCYRIVEEMNPKEHAPVVFKSDGEQQHFNSEYFMTSGNKVRFFFEDKALNEQGVLIVDRHSGLNKIGHALHWLVPEFKKVTFSQKVKDVARNLGYVDPRIVHSTYNFKPPFIGSEVKPHQDATFIFNEPLKLCGIWIALDDATLHNGCLQFVPGSHKTSPRRTQMIKDEDGEGTHFTAPFDYSDITDDQFVPVEAKAGAMIVIDGLVVHKTEANTSESPRHAYMVHMIDGHQTRWDPRCWLQPSEALPFLSLYDKQ